MTGLSNFFAWWEHKALVWQAMLLDFQVMGNYMWSAGKESQSRTAIMIKVSSFFEVFYPGDIERWSYRGGVSDQTPSDPVYNNGSGHTFILHSYIHLFMSSFHLYSESYEQSCSSQVYLSLKCCSHLDGNFPVSLNSFSGTVEHLTSSSECCRIVVLYCSLNISSLSPKV